MSKEKKTTEIKEEIKEEIKNSAQLTDEQMAEVNGGVAEIDRMLVTAELQAAERMAVQVELQKAYTAAQAGQAAVLVK